jgi:hypothetical protein
VIPRFDASGLLGTPFSFIRAYNPKLRYFDIHENDFVAFIDNLSFAQAPPVPLQVMDTAGYVVGIVYVDLSFRSLKYSYRTGRPHHWTMLAGASMNVVACVGTAATTKTRTQRFLETINREYFAPRSLKASICKNMELEEKLQYNLDKSSLA